VPDGNAGASLLRRGDLPRNSQLSGIINNRPAPYPLRRESSGIRGMGSRSVAASKGSDAERGGRGRGSTCGG